MADDSIGDGTVRHLASNQKYIARIRAAWPAFAARRQERLRQGGLFGPAVERIAENILEDLFVSVLDWPVANVNPQVDFADIVLTRLGLKWLVVEAKRPGALIGHRTAIEGALAQARRYAADQRVKTVAVSDAIMLYAADVVGGGLRSRVWLSLDTQRTRGSLVVVGARNIPALPRPGGHSGSPRRRCDGATRDRGEDAWEDATPKRIGGLCLSRSSPIATAAGSATRRRLLR